MTVVDKEVKRLSKAFVRNVCGARKANKVSKRAMARAVGVSDSTIRRIEAARSSFTKGNQGYVPSFRTVAKVADAFDVSIRDLLR